MTTIMSPTEYARFIVRHQMRNRQLSLRAVSRGSRVSLTTLHRFMRGGPVKSTTIDKIYAWSEIILP
jgi:hypothetical protein